MVWADLNQVLENHLKLFISNPSNRERWYTLGYFLGVAMCQEYPSEQYEHCLAFTTRLQQIPNRDDKETRYEHLDRWRKEVLCGKKSSS